MIVLRDNIRTNRERVYTYFAGVFPNFSSFDQVMMSCTKDHECLVLDQTSLSYDISDCVYFYKATPDLEYRLGAPEYWSYSRRNRGSRQVDDDADSSDDEVKKTRVRVKKRYPK